jgi:hypothetical protein
MKEYIKFIIWPFGTLLSNIPKYRTKTFLNVIWLFFIFYGFVMVSSIEGSDVHRYAIFFESYANQSLSLRLKYFSDYQELDYFRYITFLFVSFFSKSASVYFAFIGFIFGYFYSRIIGLLIEKTNVPIRSYGLILIVFFLFIMPFYSIQFIRFSTATVIFNYYFLKYYFVERKIKYIALTGLSILVHFSFMFAVLVLFVSLFIKVKPRLLFIFYLASLFFEIFNFDFVANLIYSFAPMSIIETKEGYLNPDLLVAQEADIKVLNWYIRYNSEIFKYALLLLLSILFFIKKNKLNIENNKAFLNAVFILGISANILSAIPSGFRFISVFYDLIWFFLILEILNNHFNFNWHTLKRWFLIPVFFYIIVGFRYAMDTIPIDLFLSNGIVAIVYRSEIPIIDIIKELIL